MSLVLHAAFPTVHPVGMRMKAFQIDMILTRLITMTLKVLNIDILPFSWALSILTSDSRDLIVIALLLCGPLLLYIIVLIVWNAYRGGHILLLGIFGVAPARMLLRAMSGTMFQSFKLFVGVSQVLILWLVAAGCCRLVSSMGCCACLACRAAFWRPRGHRQTLLEERDGWVLR